jgi:hypothetical protein
MAVCVYALTSAAMPPIGPIAGVARERLRAVRVGTITAIVGHVRRAPAPEESALRRFDRVVRRLFVAVPALLPARFGTCFDTLDELTTVLRLRQASLRRALREVRGRAQMTVRVIGAGGQPAGPLPPSSRRQRTGRGTRAASGTDYLRDRAARERYVAGFGPVRARVGRWIRRERVDRRAGVATIYHLVPRAAAASYRAAVERTAAAAGLQCLVTGPWPPYAFTDW